VVAARWLSLLASAELQWRGHASEPDPFSQGRLRSANAGGWQLMLAPAAALSAGDHWQWLIGARLPVYSDVVGNQLVPQVGGFVALSYTQQLTTPRRATAAVTASPATKHAVPGQITVVDYWATWCAPCAKISELLAAAAPRWPDVAIVKVDATQWPAAEAPSLPAGASGLPAVEIFASDGQRATLLLGADAQRVIEIVDQLRASRAADAPPANPAATASPLPRTPL
jgi:thiol-disulfide isomerase/thioredoxin